MIIVQGTARGLCEFWAKTKVTPRCQIFFSAKSTPKWFFDEWWCQRDKSDETSASSGGDRTWILFTHREHLIWLCVLECASSASSLNRSRRSAVEKCRSACALESTTTDDRIVLCVCRWKIFSSIVPGNMREEMISIELLQRTRNNQVRLRRTIKPGNSILTSWNESVHVAWFALSVSPYPSHRLLIACGIPVGVEHDQSVRSNYIKPTTTGFTAQ